MIVVLMGQDGSGKSTASKFLEEKLRESGKKVEVKRGFDYFLLHFFIRSSSARVKSMRDGFFRKSGNQPLFYIWPYIVWFDFILQIIFLDLFKRDTIIVFDRYVGDSLVGWEFFGYSSRLIRWLYLNFPKKFISFLLDVSPQVGVKRKEFENISKDDIETLEKQMRFVSYLNSGKEQKISEDVKKQVLLKFYAVQRERYLAISNCFHAKLINTAIPIKEVVNKIQVYIESLETQNKL